MSLKKYKLEVQRQVEQRWEYIVLATSEDDALEKFENHEILESTETDTCEDDGDPLVLGVKEVE